MSPQRRLKIHQLKFSYPKGKTVLRDVNMEIASGEWIAIQGPVGSGKTTFLKVLASLLPLDGGDVNWNGRSIQTDPASYRKQIGWVPSIESGMLPQLTGAENIAFFQESRKIPSSELAKQLQDWKQLLPVSEALNTLFSNCSSGMRRSLLLLRAMGHNPDILFLDEPTRSLDPASRRTFWSVMKEHHGKKTLVFSTHDPEEAKEAHRSFFVEGGTLHESP